MIAFLDAIANAVFGSLPDRGIWRKVVLTFYALFVMLGVAAAALEIFA
jgi:uncharacterized BrkB/YihY/UPF0761 family membrane protein